MRASRFALAVAVAALLAAAPAGARPHRDRTPPKVTYTTENPATLLSNPTGMKSDVLPLEVFGTARDRSGILAMRAIFLQCMESSPTTCTRPPVPAQGSNPQILMTCSSGGRSCSWRVPAPAAPGYYWFAAVAWDAHMNESRGSGILQVTVV